MQYTHIKQIMQIETHPYAFDPEPQYGEKISVPVNGINHPGLYVGGGMVIDNSRKRGGARCVTMTEFRGGRKLSYHGFSGSLSAEQVVRNAHNAVARGVDYDFLFYNCKDFVRDMRGQSLLSLVIKTAVVGSALYVGYQIARRA